jgi:hypothetical protein
VCQLGETRTDSLRLRQSEKSGNLLIQRMIIAEISLGQSQKNAQDEPPVTLTCGFGLPRPGATPTPQCQRCCEHA